MIITVQESAHRSILLTSLSYPLFVAGLVLLFVSNTIPGTVLLSSGVFLIGVNELCFYIAKSGARQDRAAAWRLRFFNSCKLWPAAEVDEGPFDPFRL